MEAHFGLEHGAYIWGRSVHNIRIERLWCDVTRGFGRKWSNFFLSLEYNCGLRPDTVEHIWLLHHLFLEAINQDALEWARSWNAHKVRFDHERTRSPADMFFFGMIQNGERGFEHEHDIEDEDIEDLQAYGIDWEEYHDAELMAHHAEHNPQQEDEEEEDEDGDDEHAPVNPFTNEGPHKLSHVEVLPPTCPLSLDGLEVLNTHLAESPHSESRNMLSRRAVWVDAFEFCATLLNNRP
ncbi:hypothetical protein C8R43DRAFT_896567 [Mycena crocata]|nr:hypothetical protein C8R43DRAFT_896567 [Mycena crocata]